ncbi:MAG TPA: ABC transporter permease [Gemmatimonadaceae bacterium]|nr:ABC transporter permease [Gemmatimonadaceae bacterium]
MSLLTQLLRRLTLLLHLRTRERDMDEEMRFHIAMEAREIERSGLSTADAEREARLVFGGIERHKEDGRDARGARLLQDLGQDLRYALRQYIANPSFTIATLLTLGVGVGASTIMYSFTKMTPVPFDHADRLVYIRQFSKTGCPSCQLVSSGNALALATSSRALQSIAFVQGPSPLGLRGSDHSDVVRAAGVTFQFLRTIGVTPLLGTGFLPSDTLPGAPPVAMLSESAWRTRFGADSAIIGRAITLDGRPHIVRGVIASRDVYPERTDVWRIITLAPSEVVDHASDLNYLTVGRLRDGATLDQARVEAQTVSRRLALEYPADFRDWQLDVRLLARYGGYGDGPTEAIFFTAVGFVLLIACANLAGVLIARLTRRRRELAVRAAMGAHASRITRQLLTETLLVCVAAGLLGVVVAHVGLRAVVDAVPESAAPAGWMGVGLDWRGLIFALGVAALCGIAIGFWPSLRFARLDLNRELRDGVRTVSTGGASGGERLRRTLVVFELALSLVLLAAAGLLVRTEANLASAPVGLSSDHVLTASVQLPSEIDGKRVESPGYFDRLALELTRIPGVTSAGAVAFLPLNRSGWSSSMFQVEGHAKLTGTGGTRTQIVTPGYFAAFRIPILHGRALTDADVDTLRRVALVNETLARRFFPDDDPIGRVLDFANGMRLTVVGIVADVKQQGAGSDPGQEIITPAATTPRRSMTMVVRTAPDPAKLASQIVKAIAAYDPNLAINRVRTMDAVVDDFLAPFRVERMLMGGFAVVAVIIATMGVYAIMGYTVAVRTREFGVRLALGASRRSLIALVLGQGVRLAAFGIVLGLAGALAATRLMRSMLFGVAPDDPLTFGLVAAGVVLVTIAAGLVPAQRALAVDPVTSLRQD